MKKEINEETFLLLDYYLNHYQLTYIQSPRHRLIFQYSQIPIEISKNGFLYVMVPYT